MTNQEEPLMSLNPKSDFELLLWERNKSKELTALLKQCHIKMGELQSELDEIKDVISQPSKKNYLKHLLELQKVCKDRRVELERYKEMYMKKHAENKRLVEQLALLNKKE